MPQHSEAPVFKRPSALSKKMIDIDDFIILNCAGTLANMNINAEILEKTKKHNQVQEKIMLAILEQLKQLNRRLENGGNHKL